MTLSHHIAVLILLSHIHFLFNCFWDFAGTGRNCKYYPPNSVERVVLTDSSDQMLLQAQQKVKDLDREEPKFAFLTADSQHLDFKDNTFDTVVDTFGLCSFDDPVAVLKEMDRVCKPDGKILLLEHGRSKTWNWITNYLDKNAGKSHILNVKICELYRKKLFYKS